MQLLAGLFHNIVENGEKRRMRDNLIKNICCNFVMFVLQRSYQIMWLVI